MMLMLNIFMWIAWAILMVWNLATTLFGLSLGLAIVAGQTPAGRIPASEIAGALVFSFAIFPSFLFSVFVGESDTAIYAGFAAFILGWVLAIAFPMYKLMIWLSN